MENYDLDVNALEDLCSTLEEPVFLIDKNYNIVWANQIFLKRYDIALGTNYSQLSGYEIHHPSTMDCMELGRLIKAVIKKDSYTIKLISLPMKYGNETVSVLQLIEYFELPETRTSIVMDTHTALLRMFVNQYPESAFMTDKNNMAVTFNESFDKEFSNTPEIRELLLKQLEFKVAQDIYDNIVRIMFHSHNVSRKILEESGRIIGYVYIFKSKSGTGHKSTSTPKIGSAQKAKTSRRK